MAGYWVSHITSLATSLLLLVEHMVGMVMVLFSREALASSWSDTQHISVS